MLDLNDLEQLTAFADCGTLTGAAEALHISQPTLTRTMKRLEEAFGVPLFRRGKNRLELNETGLQAVAQARTVLAAARGAEAQVRAFHARLHTVAVESCAPAPLWSLLPLLSRRLPDRTISSSLAEPADIPARVAGGACDIGVLPWPAEGEGLLCLPFLRESLSVCVPADHPLAGRDRLSFAELNGFNFLLRAEIGFWTGLCRRSMPASRFLVQTDEQDFLELIRASSLLFFTTDLASDTMELPPDRERIPITDPEASVTYHFLCRRSNKTCRAAAEALRGQAGQKSAGAKKSEAL